MKRCRRTTGQLSETECKRFNNKKEMSRLNFDQLLEAGVHFGHLKRKWNPAMAPPGHRGPRPGIPSILGPAGTPAQPHQADHQERSHPAPPPASHQPHSHRTHGPAHRPPPTGKTRRAGRPAPPDSPGTLRTRPSSRTPPLPSRATTRRHSRTHRRTHPRAPHREPSPPSKDREPPAPIDPDQHRSHNCNDPHTTAPPPTTPCGQPSPRHTGAAAAHHTRGAHLLREAWASTVRGGPAGRPLDACPADAFGTGGAPSRIGMIAARCDEPRGPWGALSTESVPPARPPRIPFQGAAACRAARVPVGRPGEP